MKKIIFALGFSIFAGVLLNAQSKASIDMNYVNDSSSSLYDEWTGGYSPDEINTFSQIFDIGRRLANGINYQENILSEQVPFNKGNPAYKYSAARIYGNTKRGADVILIGNTATVDTIKCLKFILRGYLETAFNCSFKDAASLAEKICWWNTNNYNNLSFINQNFEDEVSTVFAGRFTNTGLSSSYKEWKGSILIIPHEQLENLKAQVNLENETQEEQSQQVIENIENEVQVYESTENIENADSFENEDTSASFQTEKPAKKSFALKLVAIILAGILALGALIFVLIKVLLK